MRKNIIRVLCLSFAIIFSSCDKQLEEVPKSFLSPNNFFNTEAEGILAVNGVYRLIPNLFKSSGFWNVTEIGSDDIMVKLYGNVAETYQYDAANTGGANSVWNYSYSTIMNANMVLARLPKSPIKEEMKNRLMGEALFIRGMHYYFLANTFGDVPLWTNELDIAVVSTMGRSPLSEVRAQIKKDLIEAASYLPNKFTGADVGRANKAAALLLLARQYMIEKNWAEAKAAATTVSKMTEYSLMPNYADLFDIKKRNVAESVMEIQFLRDAATSMNYITNDRYTFFMPPSDSPGVFAGVNFGNNKLRSYEVFYPSVKFVNYFEAGDKRRNVVLADGFNGKPFNRMNQYNNMPFFGSKFWDLDASDYYSGKNLPFLRFAEAFLILAETENELGNTTVAHTWINKTRERAGIAPLSGLSQSQMREAIQKERAIEFCGEFQRRWDLIRWGKLIETVKSVADDNPEGAANIREHHLLFPIDENELIKNSALEQNPGY